MKALCLSAVVALLSLAPAFADDGPPQYGTPIDLETARKVIAGAQANAKQEKWPVAIAIVDTAGFLVAFERLDNTQLASVQIALEKAQTSALFRRPTRAFEDRLAEGGGNLKLLRLPGGLPMEGGLPILVDGKVIGAIGVSGVTSVQDGIIAQAGLDALAGQKD